MTAKTVSFEISGSGPPMPDVLVDHLSDANRSRDLKAERMRQIQAGFRAEMNGHVVTHIA